jgi:hypothetical protein
MVISFEIATTPLEQARVPGKPGKSFTWAKPQVLRQILGDPEDDLRSGG